MSIWKKAIPMVIAALIAGLFLFSHLFLLAAGQIKGSPHGFALDSEENLFIGTHRSFLVYRDGEQLRKIHPLPPLEYDYTFIIQDDTLIVGSRKWAAAKVYDLDGRFLADIDLEYEDIRKLEKSSTTLKMNGNVYAMKRSVLLAPATIWRNGECVYRQSLLDYLFTGIPFTCILIGLGAVFAVALLAFVTDEEVKTYLLSIKQDS